MQKSFQYIKRYTFFLVFISSFLIACPMNKRPPSFGLNAKSSGSLSCTGDICVAVGGYRNDANLPPPLNLSPFILRSADHGKTFDLITSYVLPKDIFTIAGQPGLAVLLSVSCTENYCLATGTYFTNQMTGAVFVLRSEDSGKTFPTLISIPLPSDADAAGFIAPLDVNCEKSRCNIVGFYKNLAGYQTPFSLYSKDGGKTFTSYAQITLPPDYKPTPEQTELIGVSCVDDNCVAVGGYTIAPSGKKFLVVKSDDYGETFPYYTAIDTPSDWNNLSTSTQLTNIVCGNQNCLTGGGYANTQGGQVPVALLSQNLAKSFVIVPLQLPLDFDASTPIDQKPTGIFNITCKLSKCLVVGSYPNSEGGLSPMILKSTDGGQSFLKVISYPSLINFDPTKLNSGLVGIDCKFNKDCLTVGSYSTATEVKPLILHSSDAETFANINIDLPSNSSPSSQCVAFGVSTLFFCFS